MTPYEQFKADSGADITAYQAMMHRTGGWTLIESTKKLQQFQRNISHRLVIHMFGRDLGEHLYAAYRENCYGNVLNWFGYLDAEARTYVLHEIQNNAILYSHS